VTNVPTNVDQIVFLTRVQKILDEGQFVATYKFALLIALIEVAIERGEDSGVPLKVKLDWLADKFIELYWGHAREFCGAVLFQNQGPNIAVIDRIRSLQAKTMVLAEARRLPQWQATVRGIGRIIQTMPLFRLQLLRGDQRIPFLYDEAIVDGAIELKSGIAYCLRKFSTLLGALARFGWLREVRDNPRNAYAMGSTQSLETFLFGDARVSLGRVRNVLLPLQEGKCFYCGGRLTEAMRRATPTNPTFSPTSRIFVAGALVTKARGGSSWRRSKRMAFLRTCTRVAALPAGPTSVRGRRTR
jgi:hypothetical protein